MVSLMALADGGNAINAVMWNGNISLQLIRMLTSEYISILNVAIAVDVSKRQLSHSFIN